jgi:hypothetical protein
LFYFERNARGLKLFKDWLSPEQSTYYEQHKYFEDETINACSD